MYISPPKDWWDAGDPSLPIRYVTEPGALAGCQRATARQKAERWSEEASLEGLDLVSRHQPARRGLGKPGGLSLERRDLERGVVW